MKKLVIVESPNKCQTIQHYLGNDYEVMASNGHFRDLSKRGKGGLGIDVENGFTPNWELDPAKKDVIYKLKKASKSADEVILATDPDREGEAIAWHLCDVLGLDPEQTKRLDFHEITNSAIKSAIENPGRINMNLVDARETRRMQDRIIGFKLSKLFRKKANLKSVGRVQSSTLRMIVDNDDARTSFVPEEYWNIDLLIKVDGKEVKANLSKVDGKEPSIHNEEEALAIVNKIPSNLSCTSVTVNEKHVMPKFPFTTSTLQQEASAVLKFPISKTMSIAQKLYEGMEIHGAHVALISYMRTDVTRISPEFYNQQAKPFILKHYGQEYLGPLRKGKETLNAQGAHEGIRPTDIGLRPEDVSKFLTLDEFKLYKLIYNRAIASLMAPKLVKSTTCRFEVNGLCFSLSGSQTLFDGYAKIYKSSEEDESSDVPSIAEGSCYEVASINQEQKFTQPPAPYTEGKVVKLMEEKGIGRPSTYVNTLAKLRLNKYITISKGVVSPTDDGKKAVIVLKKYFPELVTPQYTADMETTLDSISEGNFGLLDAMNDFYGPFEQKYEDTSKTMWNDHPVKTGEQCPICDADLVIRNSKFGKFIACSNYPSCTYKKSPEKAPPKSIGENCPECGKPLVERKDRKGKVFIGCSGYPACSYTRSLDGTAKGEKKASKAPTEADWVKDCPDCKQGHLVIRHGKKGDFLGCTRYPRCKHIEPLGEK